MAEQNSQNYATHRQRAPFWLVSASLALVGFILMVLSASRQLNVATAGAVCVALSSLCAVVMVRGYALRLQNRVIRLEMQVRLATLGRGADLVKLEMPQIIALRFASDVELPALIGRALAERLSADQIKRAVTAWQGDYLRV